MSEARGEEEGEEGGGEGRGSGERGEVVYRSDGAVM